MGDFFFYEWCIVAYCTLISTEQIDKLKVNPIISYLMYFKIPSDQPKNQEILYSHYHQDLNKVSVFCSELLNF